MAVASCGREQYQRSRGQHVAVGPREESAEIKTFLLLEKWRIVKMNLHFLSI